jgi:hypothetical protein
MCAGDCHVNLGPIHAGAIIALDKQCPQSEEMQQRYNLQWREGGQLVWPHPVLALHVMRGNKVSCIIATNAT